MLDERGGVQWPCRSENEASVAERRLFEDGTFYHVDGKAKILFERPRAMPELPDECFPLLLLTGRGTSAQWHTQTRTAKSGLLRKLYPRDIYVEINEEDAAKLGISSGAMVVVTSRRGRLEARAFVTLTIQPGQVFIPMHYERTNQLTHASVDPYSRQPAYKACAVRLEKSS
jgi:assimilatory nitrate reductase catalytic subunit